MSENQKLFALLIDGDNAQISFIPHILQKLNEYGELRISKVFHNKATIEQWEQIASEYSIEPIWVPNNTSHKNSVDIALVMDAMSLLYEYTEITNFCIVASDSDYTRLARLLKSRGKFVLGIGTKQTPKPFSNACTQFVHIEDLVNIPPPTEQPLKPALAAPTVVAELSDKEFLKLFVSAYKFATKNGLVDGDSGWIQLRDIKEIMGQRNSKFLATDTYKNMRTFVKQMKSLAEASPRSIEVNELSESTPIIHNVRMFGERELEKFCTAYKQAAEDLKQKDKNGWVSLSAIGETLRAIYPNYQPLVYRNIKYSQLKKVVGQMMIDYPTKLEINPKSQHPEIRIKQ